KWADWPDTHIVIATLHDRLDRRHVVERGAAGNGGAYSGHGDARPHALNELDNVGVLIAGERKDAAGERGGHCSGRGVASLQLLQLKSDGRTAAGRVAHRGCLRRA